MIRIVGIVAGIAALYLCIHETTLSGHADVIDGDSLRIGDVEVRLFGIDAPESDQICRDDRQQPYKCGLLATSALEQMIGDLPVTCYVMSGDRYGRTVAICEVNGRDLGEALVRQGMAVAYRHYSVRYVEAEEEARRDHRGLWAGQFDNPAEWRHRQIQK
jgi:endonuclease YncB( thermonuclease family)